MTNKYEIVFPSLTRIYRSLTLPEIIKVTSDSQLLLRKSVQACAVYFQREGYSDWIHYDLEGDESISFLFADTSGHPYAYGAVCFRLREYKGYQEKIWHLHWAWIHPYHRNKGLLSKYVPLFNKQFGYWYPEQPHSKAMTNFIIKHGIINPWDKLEQT